MFIPISFFDADIDPDPDPDHPYDIRTGKRLPLPANIEYDVMPVGLERDLYKYRKLDPITNTHSDDYILAIYETVYKDEHDIDGSIIAKWSIYRLDDISEDEEHITPYDEFNKMLDSEGWENVGHELVVMR